MIRIEFQTTNNNPRLVYFTIYRLWDEKVLIYQYLSGNILHYLQLSNVICACIWMGDCWSLLLIGMSVMLGINAAANTSMQSENHVSHHPSLTWTCLRLFL
jgi:hypothetical protein